MRMDPRIKWHLDNRSILRSSRIANSKSASTEVSDELYLGSIKSTEFLYTDCVAFTVLEIALTEHFTLVHFSVSSSLIWYLIKFYVTIDSIVSMKKSLQ